MILLRKRKDGGPESHVWGYWLIELKSLFTIVLLRFEDGSRDAYHNHAFNALSWVLRGELKEDRILEPGWHVRRDYRPSFWPILTTRSNMHKVRSVGRSWVFSIRGPWNQTWNEYIPGQDRRVTLAAGRREI